MPANTYGRQVVLPLTNKSGGQVIAGDVVVVDTTNNDAFTTSTSGSVTIGVGVAQETIASNATGRVAIGGYVALVNVNASVTRGNYGKTYTVAKQATDAGAARIQGTFCQFLTGGTTPDAYIYQPDLGGASLTNPMTTSQDIIVGGASGTPGRLAVGAAGAHLSVINSAVAWNSGTSNPGSAVTGDRYWRTDLGLEVYYDGTRWLTTTLYHAFMGTNLAISAINNGARFRPLTKGLDLWLVALDISTAVFGTNDGSNFWTITLDKRAVGDAATTIITFNTSAHTASNWTAVTTAIGASVAVSTHFNFIIQASVKTGAPANLNVDGGFTYRLIVT